MCVWVIEIRANDASIDEGLNICGQREREGA